MSKSTSYEKVETRSSDRLLPVSNGLKINVNSSSHENEVTALASS